MVSEGPTFVGEFPGKMYPLKNITLLCTAFLLIFSTSNILSQCVPTGATIPSTVTNNSATGSLGWSNLLNGLSSNNSYISCGTLLGVLASAQTNYIQSSGYGFAIPATATVCGIEVRVERNAVGLLIGSSITDKNVFLTKAGAQVGTNHASGAGWSGSDGVAVYGNNADLWGTTWTPAQINAANFGVLFSAQMNAGLASLLLTANIDAITVTVHYDAGALPVEFISFNGEQESQTIRLEWKTATEKNNAYFDVEKMNEDYSWRVIETIAGKGNSSGVNAYLSYDEHPDAINYYRIRQVDLNRQSSLSETISVDYKNGSRNKPVIYPVPANNVLNIDYELPVQNIEVFSSKGLSIETGFQEEENRTRLNVASLAPGIYFLKLHTRADVIVTRFIKE